MENKKCLSIFVIWLLLIYFFKLEFFKKAFSSCQDFNAICWRNQIQYTASLMKKKYKNAPHSMEALCCVKWRQHACFCKHILQEKLQQQQQYPPCTSKVMTCDIQLALHIWFHVPTYTVVAHRLGRDTHFSHYLEMQSKKYGHFCYWNF